MNPTLSIVIPALNEADAIGATLQRLQAMRGRGVEVLLVDGGSSDATLACAAGLVDQVLHSPPGRARQLHCGAAAARAAVLLLLHADTLLPPDADQGVLAALAPHQRRWGFFAVRLAGRSPLLPLVAAGISLRSRCSGLCTGDQAMFMRRAELQAVGGIPPQLLMEDLELAIRLRRRSRPCCLPRPVITSGRRWDQRGVLATVWLMWRIRWLYWRGVPADRLAQLYR